MDATAVIFEKPGKLALNHVAFKTPQAGDLIVESKFSGISTGTERLLWEGKMPEFPGMGYPLVPGYETVGEIVEVIGESPYKVGQSVFVPGSANYKNVRGLFGGAASRLVVGSERVAVLEACEEKEGVLLALAATAYHAVTRPGSKLPNLVVGCGVLGRLITRMCVALGGDAPAIWETDPIRCKSFDGFTVMDPNSDEDGVYETIIDVSGKSDILDTLMPHLAKGGEVVLAGFYSERVNFAFPPAFMKEARVKIAAEWLPEDLAAVSTLLADGKLSLADLVSHECPASDAARAYETAFGNPECLKMVLSWRGNA